jgi:hypothetical protein
MIRISRGLPALLVAAAIAIALLIVRNWAYVTTYRLYLTQRVDASHSAAAERFDIEDNRVVPQIVCRDDDRVGFKTELTQSSTLHVVVRTSGPSSWEIRWREGTGVQVLARGDGSEATTVTRSIPARHGTLEFISHGAITWIDPRLVRDLVVLPHLVVIAALLAGAFVLARRLPMPPAVSVDRLAWFRCAALAGSIAIGLLVLEGGLRALGDRVPRGIASERHDLGEVRQDPRWEDTPLFGRRLRRRVNAVNEWRYGDIVRMGYVSATVSDGILHRFAFQTDDEGFRNARVRQEFDVAALGDSFTDAMTLPIEDAWPTRLERRTGLTVQNYGTAGFGPQQELRALTTYAARHRPHTVVLAYFAGNDLFDAEAFDEFERSGGAIRRPVQGWQIKDVVSRADTWFLVSAARATSVWISGLERAEARGDRSPSSVPVDPAPATGVTFDRGMFTAGVNGRTIRWAFMPPYLNTLNFSERDLAARRGWELTRRAIDEMHDVSNHIGARFVVMFLPFKSQVYLPWLAESLNRSDLSRDLRFYLPDRPGAPDIATLLRNRLAQNRLMRAFCEERGISFLDTTDALSARFTAGENVYFPDESHLNELGHAIVAEALAAQLQR